MGKIRLAEIDGRRASRLQKIRESFEKADIRVEIQDNILHWLWVHFAINAGLIAARFKAGGPSQLLNDIPLLRRGILACREALAVCRARGVNIKAFAETKQLYLPAWIGAAAGSIMMKADPIRRRIAEYHSNPDELRRIYCDVLDTGERLNVAMPHYKSFKQYVDSC